MVRLADIPEPERSVIADLDCPAYEDTAVFPVREDNGQIYVRDDRWD